MNITILGSTGSIGTQSLEVIDEMSSLRGENNGDYQVFALCANNSVELLENQVRKFKPEFCVAYDENKANDLKIKLKDTNTKILSGMDGINFIASHEKTDYVINALMGEIGLKPTLSAIRAKKSVGLANKETLVAAGDIVMAETKKSGSDIFPIDSEHCAILQCIQGENKQGIEKLILTASGGPFYGRKRDDLKNVTVADALRHPTWKMGKKITIDSATMMNKGLELIEACHLFCSTCSSGAMPDNVEIIIHRESIIHSFVQFIDKSVKAQLSLPDMKLCIQYALTYRNREKSKCRELDLTELKNLSFAKPDGETFIFPELARFAIKEGGVLPAVMNAANEIAVGLFLEAKIRFLDIFDSVEKTVADWEHKNIKSPNIDDIIGCAEDVKRHFISKYL